MGVLGLEENLHGDCRQGYDTNNIRALIAACGAASVIPGKSNRKEPIPYDRKLYSTRRNIEITFGKLKENKRVNLRFDKLDGLSP